MTATLFNDLNDMMTNGDICDGWWCALALLSHTGEHKFVTRPHTLIT